MSNTLLQCLLMLVIDYGQTQDIKNNPGLIETNVFMGRYPESTTVQAYFAGAALTYTFIDRYLPEFSEVSGIFCLSTHGHVVEQNINLGIGWSFK